jgi:hypothetical protein
MNDGLAEFNLSRQDGNATDALDLALSALGEELGLDNDRLLGQHALAQDLEVTLKQDRKQINMKFHTVQDGEESKEKFMNTYSLHAVNDRDLVLGGISIGILSLGLLRDQRPDRIQVDGRAEELVVGLVEVTHTDLAKVARVVLVHVDAVVVLTTGVTATTRVLAVLADATITHGHVTTLLASLLQSGRLRTRKKESIHKRNKLKTTK